MSAAAVAPGPAPAGVAADDDYTLIDAQAAYSGVSALVEILAGCPPGYQVTGIFVHSLLVDVRMHLENVVGALNPRAGLAMCQEHRVQ